MLFVVVVLFCFCPLKFHCELYFMLYLIDTLIWFTITVRAEIFAVVLFSRISRVKPSRKFPLQFMSIYSNDNISKIAKLTTRELPHLAKTAKITVRENFSSYSSLILYLLVSRLKLGLDVTQLSIIIFVFFLCTDYSDNLMLCLFLLTRLIFHVFELLFKMYCQFLCNC